MKKSQRLRPVIKIAKNREENAAKALSEGRRIHSRNEAKLAELLAYQKEYTRRYEDAGRNGINVDKINEFRRFLERLNDAISSQKKIVKVSTVELDKKNKAWSQTRVKHKSLDKVAGRHRADENRDEERGEQSESDDRSQHIKFKEV